MKRIGKKEEGLERRGRSASKKRGQDSGKSRRKGEPVAALPLEEATRRIVQVLAAKGSMELKDLQGRVDINSRRAYEMLNVPSERPLLARRKLRPGSELVFLDGQPLRLPDIRSVHDQLQEELEQLRQLLSHVAAVRRELRPCEEKRQQPSSHLRPDGRTAMEKEE